MSEIAILMAAGLGSRMRPITNDKPKPLVPVCGKPMIETMIEGLQHRNIAHYYIVVGYLKEQFTYLTQKYENVTIVENKEYLEKNNISSIHAVCDVMKKHDCFICESDVVVSDPSIFDEVPDYSCYYGKMVEGDSDDWVFDMDGDRVIRVGKKGTDTYNMVGIAHFLQKDAKVIAEQIEQAYEQVGHEQLFWDEIVDQNLKDLYIGIKPVNKGQLIEIDTVDELIQIDPTYQNFRSE